MAKLILDKPVIVVFLNQIDEKAIQPLLFGMEEEGIPFEIRHSTINDTKKAAYEAASLSALSVGIACDSKEAFVHSRNLHIDEPLFHHVFQKSLSNHPLRNLGGNAARLVKGLPFNVLTQ